MPRIPLASGSFQGGGGGGSTADVNVVSPNPLPVDDKTTALVLNYDKREFVGANTVNTASLTTGSLKMLHINVKLGAPTFTGADAQTTTLEEGQIFEVSMENMRHSLADFSLTRGATDTVLVSYAYV